MDFETRMTIGKGCDEIRSEVGDPSGKSSETSFISDRFIYDEIIGQRARIVREKMEARVEINPQMYQTIPSMEVVETNVEMSPCIPPDNCYFLSSRMYLPEMLSTPKVTSTNASKQYTYVDWDKISYRINSRIKASAFRPYFGMRTLHKGTRIELYDYSNNQYEQEYAKKLKNTPNLLIKQISVTAIFKNPLRVQKIKWCSEDEEVCHDDKQFMLFVDSDTWAIIKERVCDYIWRYRNGATDREQDMRDGVIDKPSRIK